MSAGIYCYHNEIFRSQDQFNPQDLALATLSGLEESRVALWSVRAALAFYEVGPFEDVRLEIGVNLDDFEPADLGYCGEPYTVVLVCAGTFGFLAHGFEGAGIAGVRRVESPWNSSRGIEAGIRLEWRFDRFSFALTDFYGYSDVPYVEKIFTFERNVDPVTGRPRRLNDRGDCQRGDEPACRQPGRGRSCGGCAGALVQPPQTWQGGSRNGTWFEGRAAPSWRISFGRDVGVVARPPPPVVAGMPPAFPGTQRRYPMRSRMFLAPALASRASQLSKEQLLRRYG